MSPNKGSFSSKNRNYILTFLRMYMEECYFEPGENWPDDEFRKRCIERWAANEILDFIKIQILLSPMEAVHNYLRFLRNLYKTYEKGDQDIIFTTAIEVCNDIGVLLV